MNVKEREVEMVKISMIQLDFDRLDYENYDYDGIGVLNFNKAPTTTKRPNRRKPATKISKRYKLYSWRWLYNLDKINNNFQNSRPKQVKDIKIL